MEFFSFFFLKLNNLQIFLIRNKEWILKVILQTEGVQSSSVEKIGALLESLRRNNGASKNLISKEKTFSARVGGN